MNRCIHHLFSIGLIIMAGISASPLTLPPDVNALPRVKTTYIPIIPDTSHHEAMDKLKELWTKQLDHLNTVKQAAEDVVNKTGRGIRQFGWVYNDTEERIKEQIQALSDTPSKNNDEMKTAVDSETIYLQKKGWDAMEKCLNDHYEFRPEDEQQRHFRKTLDTAREDLLSREKEIKLVVEQKSNPAKS